MTAHVLRVFPVESTNRPHVLAYADGFTVRWDPIEGWRCGCAVNACPHMVAVQALLDPRVTGGVHVPRTPGRARQVRRRPGGAR